MKSHRRIHRLRRIKQASLLVALAALNSHCGNLIPHKGRIPFSWMERAPSNKLDDAAPMTVIHRHSDPDKEPSASELGQIQAGDVIAFTMSHQQAWSHLRKGHIQKIPYELFRYGHVALVVPSGSGELKLLQVAMKQAVNADDGLDYLYDKTWEIHRPPSGSVNLTRLQEFAARVTKNGSDPKRAYDYVSVSGWNNSPWQPEQESEIGDKFSCATLVVSGLHYAGYELDAVHRGGRFDLVTPRQVVESSGTSRDD